MTDRADVKATDPNWCVLTAVLPQYRTNFVREFSDLTQGRCQFLAGDEHLDPSVRTGVPPEFYTPTSNRFILGRRLIIQYGGFTPAVRAGVTVVDLNPRSVTAWSVLVARALLGRRTLTWGHLHPREGPLAHTALVRTAMRRLGDGMITYTMTDRDTLLTADPGAAVWVAPNALYPASQLNAPLPSRRRRTDILYVGRLEPAKRPGLLLQAFADALPRLPVTARLIFVGDGTQRTELGRLASNLHITDRVDLPGHCADTRRLEELYARAACSVSPGYVGLSLTQSLGFGVPMVVADDEPHAPEVELAVPGAVTWFEASSASELSECLVHACSSPPDKQRSAELRQVILDSYTTDAMARGFRDALASRTARPADNCRRRTSGVARS